MSLLIIHISDIHFKNKGNHILSKEKLIFAAINSQIDPNIETIFCVITGDIAFSGNDEEYNIACDFLAKFEEETQRQIYFVVCPGNHDCDFSATDSTREMILDSCFKNPDQQCLEDVIKNCCQSQNNFHDFKECIDESISINCIKYGNELLQVKKYHISSGHSIKFLCYNTAWCSLKSEGKSQVGKKIFPINYVQKILQKKAAADLTISMFHHPYNWLNPDNMRTFRDLVESTSDIVLTGHEH